MPPKSRKRKQLLTNLEAANQAKKKRELAGEGESVVETVDTARTQGDPSEAAQLLRLSDNALDTEDEDIDPTFQSRQQLTFGC